VKQYERNAKGMVMKLSRQKARKCVLDQFKYVRTCALARELCVLVRTQRAVLDREDVRAFCSFISKLCEEFGCKEASEHCEKAAEAVIESEEKYLELCEQSCKKCGESRQPRISTTERSVYVA
jgi:hypothetical protein